MIGKQALSWIYSTLSKLWKEGYPKISVLATTFWM